jgi:sphingolipid delta-4 desaturase
MPELDPVDPAQAKPAKLPTSVDMWKDPRVRALLGNDRMEAMLILLVVVVDLGTSMAFSLFSSTWPWYVRILVIFCIGTTIRHSATLGMHECSHNLVGATETENYFWGFLANLPLVFPASVRFRRYHMVHHANPNNLEKDPDMPSQWEKEHLLTSLPGRILFLILQPVFYGIRPCILFPLQPDGMEALNYALQIAFLAVWYKIVGVGGMIYMLGAVAMMGLHPASGHFVAEHARSASANGDNADADYVTFSYYGWWNPIMFNVGYHREHHDVPKCPGSRLPQLRKLYPELYGDQANDKFYGFGGPLDGWFDGYCKFILNPYDRVTVTTASSS